MKVKEFIQNVSASWVSCTSSHHHALFLSPLSWGVRRGPLFQVLQNVADGTAEDGAVVPLSGQLWSIWTSDLSIGLIAGPLKHWKAHYEIAGGKKERERATNERFRKFLLQETILILIIIQLYMA